MMLRKPRWAVGSNMPGYMPDSEPAHFASWKEARDCFVYDVEQAIEDEEHPERYTVERGTIERARKARKAQEFSTRVGQYVFWLSRI